MQDKIEEDKAAEEQRLAILPPKKPEGPGELGKPHRVDKAKVDEETKRRIELGWQNNAYNEYVSDLISVHRWALGNCLGQPHHHRTPNCGLLRLHI